MTIQIFLILLTIFASFTSLLTEGIKKFLTGLDKSYASNIIVLISAVVVGILGTSIAYLVIGVPWTLTNIAFILVMVIANWLGAMLGYDKVKQAITQLLAKK